MSRSARKQGWQNRSLVGWLLVCGLPVMLAALSLVVVMVKGYATGWRGVGVVLLLMALLMMLTADAFAAWVETENKKRALVWLWWCACGWCVPLGCVLLAWPVAAAAKHYPKALAPKLEAYRKAAGHYPASLSEVDYANPLRWLVSYEGRSEGYVFRFTPTFGPGAPMLTYTSGRNEWHDGL